MAGLGVMLYETLFIYQDPKFPTSTLWSDHDQCHSLHLSGFHVGADPHLVKGHPTFATNQNVIENVCSVCHPALQ